MNKPYPPPPVSCGTHKEKERDVLKEGICKQVAPIFAAALGKSPEEVKRDIMDISGRPFRIVWRPNNYRRQMVINEVSDIPLKKLQAIYRDVKVSKKRVAFVRDYPGVLLIVGRTQLQGVWCQPVVRGRKEVVLIERQTMVGVEEALDSKKAVIREQIDSAMFDFARKLGLFIKGGVPVWRRYEDWVKGEEVIDSLPPDLIMHDTFFKKVYGGGIEFKQTSSGESPVVHLKQYIKNRAIEDVAPEIARSLDGVRDALRRLNPEGVLSELKDKIKVFPDDVLVPEVLELVSSLGYDDRVLYSDWLFEAFGGRT